MNDEPTTVNDEQAAGVGAARFCCAVAIVLFAVYAVSRGQTWAHMAIVAQGKALTVHEAAVAGTQWSGLRTPLVLCGAALIGANVLYIAFYDSIDLLVATIANFAIGGALSVLTAYFILDTNGVLGHSGRSVSFEYTAAGGAYFALGVALAICVTGFIQLRIRGRIR